MSREAALQDLLELGFEERRCREALERADGNRDTAIELLLAHVDDPKAYETAFPSEINERITVLEMSQYSLTDTSSSACTSIAYFFVAKALESIEKGVSFENIGDLTAILFEGVSTFESVKALSGGRHLSVEEFVQFVPGPTSLRMCGVPTQHILSQSNIEVYLSGVLKNEYVSSRSPVGIVITKPPESVAVVIDPIKSIYYLFDSHSRPQLGIDGAYLIACDSTESISKRLSLIFPAIDSTDGTMMEMMYNSFEGTLFQCDQDRDPPCPVVT